MDHDRRPGWKLLVAGALLVASVIVGLGFILVPAHWTSIWADREFTGWVAPIADRLSVHSRLYEHGLHSPMPPLPFVLVHALFPKGATWFAESLLNFCFQAGTVLLLFVAFARTWGLGISLAAALSTIPVFFALPKSILYDSLAQFLVAAVAIAAVAGAPPDPLREQGRGAPWRLPLLGLLLALLILSKQSTGAGTAMAVSLWLLVRPSSATILQRLVRVLLCGICTMGAMAAIGLLLSPWVSFSGLLHDVFITGSQPKGGSAALLGNLGNQIRDTAIGSALVGSALFAVCLCLRAQLPLVRRFLAAPFQFIARRDPAPSDCRLLAVGALASTFGLTLAIVGADWLGRSIRADPGAPNSGIHSVVLQVGLFLCLLTAASLFFRLRRGGSEARPEAGYALIFGLSALFHSLSVTIFRWYYDNNPLVMLALASVAAFCLSANEWRWKGAVVSLRWVPAALFGLLILSEWPLMVRQIHFASRCTQEWSEVAYLKSARLRPESVGMRDLVGIVRSSADASRDRTVLLLPNDPNVEAWFDRPRPGLSSAIIFVDQYWDHFVDADFAELESHPPAVIVIGPSRFWRQFSRRYHRNWGAERLIDLIYARLLPTRYSLQKQQLISFLGSGDTMEVYVRNEKGM